MGLGRIRGADEESGKWRRARERIRCPLSAMCGVPAGDLPLAAPSTSWLQ